MGLSLASLFSLADHAFAARLARRLATRWRREFCRPTLPLIRVRRSLGARSGENSSILRSSLDSLRPPLLPLWGRRLRQAPRARPRDLLRSRGGSPPSSSPRQPDSLPPGFRSLQAQYVLNSSLSVTSLNPFAVAACGVAVPWLMHKCLPGVLNAKSYPHAAFTSHKGLVLGPNIVERESSTWSKVRPCLASFSSSGADEVSSSLELRILRRSATLSSRLALLTSTGVRRRSLFWARRS